MELLKKIEYSNFPNSSWLFWPEGRITFKLHPDLTQDHKDNISHSFAAFHRKTCIRFEPHHDTLKQTAYLSIEPCNYVKCALSSFYYKNTYQFMRINPNSFTPATLIHQLGHSLCLPHEHQRNDRDDYDDFSYYAFESQMHKQCDKCNGGLPKAMQVFRCGVDVHSKLSTLDADKINELYNCHGCVRHRWRSTGSLANSDKQAMIPFGFSQSDNQSTYLCRASVGGEIIPGTYRLDKNICCVPFLSEVFKVREHVKVFTLPQPRNAVEDGMFKHATYRMIPFYETSSQDRWVPVGQTLHGTTTYAAVGFLREDPRFMRFEVIGKA